MDEKVKIKNESDYKIAEGNSKFEEYLQNGNLEDWGKKYLFFLDPQDVVLVIDYYKQIYKC